MLKFRIKRNHFQKMGDHKAILQNLTINLLLKSPRGLRRNHKKILIAILVLTHQESLLLLLMMICLLQTIEGLSHNIWSINNFRLFNINKILIDFLKILVMRQTLFILKIIILAISTKAVKRKKRKWFKVEIIKSKNINKMKAWVIVRP